MKKQQHTLGNWSIKESGLGDIDIISDRSNWFIAKDVLIHDARLIVAAPEMLEELIYNVKCGKEVLPEYIINNIIN